LVIALLEASVVEVASALVGFIHEKPKAAVAGSTTSNDIFPHSAAAIEPS
jgi:hypothetical protein